RARYARPPGGSLAIAVKSELLGRTIYRRPACPPRVLRQEPGGVKHILPSNGFSTMTSNAELPGEYGTGRLVHGHRHCVRCLLTPQALPAAVRNHDTRQFSSVSPTCRRCFSLTLDHPGQRTAAVAGDPILRRRLPDRPQTWSVATRDHWMANEPV